EVSVIVSGGLGGMQVFGIGFNACGGRVRFESYLKVPVEQGIGGVCSVVPVHYQHAFWRSSLLGQSPWRRWNQHSPDQQGRSSELSDGPHLDQIASQVVANVVRSSFSPLLPAVRPNLSEQIAFDYSA